MIALVLHLRYIKIGLLLCFVLSDDRSLQLLAKPALLYHHRMDFHRARYGRLLELYFFLGLYCSGIFVLKHSDAIFSSFNISFTNQLTHLHRSMSINKFQMVTLDNLFK